MGVSGISPSVVSLGRSSNRSAGGAKRTQSEHQHAGGGVQELESSLLWTWDGCVWMWVVNKYRLNCGLASCWWTEGRKGEKKGKSGEKKKKPLVF